MEFKYLISGIDTLECAYYLAPSVEKHLDFDWLGFEKENLRQSKGKPSKVITLGNSEFFLRPYGSSSGYPFVIENEHFIISFGEFNNPNFFVKFKSVALWHEGPQILHQQFLTWASSIGYTPLQDERLSRVDTAFDYYIPEIDFCEDNIVSLSKKDSRHRQDRKLQTLTFGKGDIVLRIYDKVAEIEEKSKKTWFFKLWGEEENVWRIELQVRKPVLKRFGIRNFQDLAERQGDLLRYLVSEHSTMRRACADRNRSRWPLHLLWVDLQVQVDSFCGLGVHREFDYVALLEEKVIRNAISIYGYTKQMAALKCVKHKQTDIEFYDAMKYLYRKVKQVHNQFSWEIDVEKKINKIRLEQ